MDNELVTIKIKRADHDWLISEMTRRKLDRNPAYNTHEIISEAIAVYRSHADKVEDKQF